MKGLAALMLFVLAALVATSLSAGVVAYVGQRSHGKWCQAHSHEMPAKRAPGDVMGPVWMPEGCP